MWHAEQFSTILKHNSELMSYAFHWRSSHFSVLLICRLVKAVNVQTVTMCLGAILQNSNCLVVSTPRHQILGRSSAPPTPFGILRIPNSIHSASTQRVLSATAILSKESATWDYLKHKLSMVYFHHSTH